MSLVSLIIEDVICYDSELYTVKTNFVWNGLDYLLIDITLILELLKVN